MFFLYHNSSFSKKIINKLLFYSKLFHNHFISKYLYFYILVTLHVDGILKISLESADAGIDSSFKEEQFN